MFGFMDSKRWPIALDLGAQSLKLLQVQPVGHELAVRAAARHRLPATVVADSEQWREQAVVAVKEMLRSNPFRGRHCVSSIASRHLRIKNVRLPSLPAEELAQAVQWEAKERFGCDFATDQLFHLRAGQVRQGSDTFEEVILLAVSGEAIQNHLNLLSAMGLEPVHIDAEPMAIFRPFERTLRRESDSTAINVIADIGHSATKVLVARGQKILIIKSLDVGGKDFTAAVAKHLSVEVEEAAELRGQSFRPPRNQAGEGEGAPGADAVNWTILDAVRGLTGELAKEISLCLRYCSVTFRGLRPDHVKVIGGQAYDRGLVQQLSELVGVQCEVGQPLRGVDVTNMGECAIGQESLAEWAVCAGLAIRSAPMVAGKSRTNDESHRLSA
jgi:type IV pilus assembly protein PilM